MGNVNKKEDFGLKTFSLGQRRRTVSLACDTRNDSSLSSVYFLLSIIILDIIKSIQCSMIMVSGTCEGEKPQGTAVAVPLTRSDECLMLWRYMAFFIHPDV